MKQLKSKDLKGFFSNKNALDFASNDLIQEFGRAFRLFSFYINQHPVIPKGESFHEALMRVMNEALDGREIEYDIYFFNNEDSLILYNTNDRMYLVAAESIYYPIYAPNMEIGIQLSWMKNYMKELYEICILYFNLMSKKDFMFFDTSEKEVTGKLEDTYFHFEGEISRLRKEIYSANATIEKLEEKLKIYKPKYLEDDVLCSIFWFTIPFFKGDKNLYDLCLPKITEYSSNELMGPEYSYNFIYSSDDEEMEQYIADFEETCNNDGYSRIWITSYTEISIDKNNIIRDTSNESPYQLLVDNVLNGLCKTFKQFKKWTKLGLLEDRLLSPQTPSLLTKTIQETIMLNHITSITEEWDLENR